MSSAVVILSGLTKQATAAWRAAITDNEREGRRSHSRRRFRPKFSECCSRYLRRVIQPVERGVVFRIENLQRTSGLGDGSDRTEDDVTTTTNLCSS